MAVDASDVSRVLGGTDLEGPALEKFIGAAGRMFDSRTKGESIPEDVRDDVVEQLAAHMVATAPERQVSSAREGDGQVSFEGETGEGLSGTTHGQLAITLDPTNALANADKPTASITVPSTKD